MYIHVGSTYGIYIWYLHMAQRKSNQTPLPSENSILANKKRAFSMRNQGTRRGCDIAWLIISQDLGILEPTRARCTIKTSKKRKQNKTLCLWFGPAIDVSEPSRPIDFIPFHNLVTHTVDHKTGIVPTE